MYEAIYCTSSWVFGFLLAPSFLLSVAAGPALSQEVTLHFEPGCYIFYFISQTRPSSTILMLLCFQIVFQGAVECGQFLLPLTPSSKLRRLTIVCFWFFFPGKL